MADWNSQFVEGLKKAVINPGEAIGKASEGAWKIVTNPGEAAGKAAEAWVDGKVQKAFESFFAGGINLFQSFMTSWLHGPGAFPKNKINQAMEWMGWVTSPLIWIAMALGLTVAGVRVAWSHRGEELKDIVSHVARVSLVAGGGSFFVGVMLTLSDGLVVWIIDVSGWKPEETKGLFELGLASGGVLFLGLAIIGILMIVIVFIQWPMMILKTFAVPIILVYWPISEAMNMAAGQMRFSRAARWLVGFILYKPTVAILYAFAFTLLKEGTKEKDPLAVLANLMMAESVLLLSVFALPAILKIVMPSAAAVGPSGGGDVLVEAVKTAVEAAVVAASAGAGGAGAGAAAGGAAKGGGSGVSSGEIGPTLEESGQVPSDSYKSEPSPSSRSESGSGSRQGSGVQREPQPESEQPQSVPSPRTEEQPVPAGESAPSSVQEPEPSPSSRSESGSGSRQGSGVQREPQPESEQPQSVPSPRTEERAEGPGRVPVQYPRQRPSRRKVEQRSLQMASPFAYAVMEFTQNTPDLDEQIVDERYLDLDSQ